ncbi:restriction endonuclease [Marinicauda salina]|uniref:Restriction endonuclease n=2 Tax=Marinicauda salina TaxID=2135793 RepID=A0A2U2BSA8_9PROT|nr:restriction endonuclease [Marinicauda salina]
METSTACSVMKATCPDEWTDIVDFLSNYRLDPKYWLKAGGNRGDIASQIDKFFHDRGWVEARLDLETVAKLFDKDGRLITTKDPITQEGYLVDNFKNRVALDVEWNAKDGNLDRDLAAYRSWHESGLISAAVIITKERRSLLELARELWEDFQSTLPKSEQSAKLPIDLSTTTVTAFDKAELRIRRGVMGTCPTLVIGANRATWNGEPYEDL